MRFALHICALSLGAALLACSSTPATTITIVRPELVAVDPQDFLGGEQCGDQAGMVQSYVATLYDVTPASDGSPLPGTGVPLSSSPPTSCFFPVTFSFVQVNHRYRALIEAYDNPPADSDAGVNDAADCDAGDNDAGDNDAGDNDAGDNDAGPCRAGPPAIEAVTLGERPQQVIGTQTPVAPSWTATCGGYPPTITEAGVPDAAAYITSADLQDAGDAAIPGVLSYDAITQTVHNCGAGLVPVK